MFKKESLPSDLLEKLKSFDGSSLKINQLFRTLFPVEVGGDSEKCLSCKTEKLVFQVGDDDKCFFFSFCEDCKELDYDYEQFSDYVEDNYDSLLDFLIDFVDQVDIRGLKDDFKHPGFQFKESANGRTAEGNENLNKIPLTKSFYWKVNGEDNSRIDLKRYQIEYIIRAFEKEGIKLPQDFYDALDQLPEK